MHHFADKGPYRQSYGFFPVVMYGCESWTIKVEHQRIYVFELWCWGRFLRILWKARRANQSILKETNPEYWKNWYWSWSSKTLANWCKELTHWKKKNPDTGKDWRQEEKGATEDEMVGWHHWPNGHEFEQTQADNEGQGSLVCCSPWGRKESDMAYWLNKNDPQTNSSLFTSVPIQETF